MSDTGERNIGRELYADILTANDMLRMAAAEIEKRNGGKPSEAWMVACKEIGATLFIERNKERRGQAAEASRSRGRTRKSGSGASPERVPGPIDSCPKCGGQVWDNRPKKASGEWKQNAPDFRCRDKACDTPVWIEKSHTDAELGNEALAAADGLPF